MKRFLSHDRLVVLAILAILAGAALPFSRIAGAAAGASFLGVLVCPFVRDLGSMRDHKR